MLSKKNLRRILILLTLFMISGKIVDNPLYTNQGYKRVIVREDDIISVEVKKEDVGSLELYTKDLIERVKRIANSDYQTVIDSLNTPLKTSIYCTKVLKRGEKGIDQKLYGESDYWASFERVHKNQVDDCDGGALAAAAILSDDGFPPYILFIKDDSTNHTVFLYKNQHGKYGSIGIRESDIKPPIYSNIKDLATTLINSKSNLALEYRVYDLGKKFPDFIDNNKNNDLIPNFKY